MIAIVLATVANISPMLDESINRMCARQAGITYASDNFTVHEWQQFQLCREIMQDNVERTATAL